MAPSSSETRRRRFRTAVGPGWIVAAAFLGPGTITTATLAGAGFGTALLWALVFSTLATMGLQEMAARLGLVTGDGLGDAIRGRFHGSGRILAALMVVVAIAGGNAAYQTGNLLGGSLGLQGIVGGDVRLWVAILGALAFALLWTGSYRLVERVMAVMVAVMSLVFLATAVTLLPSAGPFLADMLVPSLPEGSLLVAVGLVGTTVVPYNLFLHASAVGERYPDGEKDLPAQRDPQDRERVTILAALAVGEIRSPTLLKYLPPLLADPSQQVRLAAAKAVLRSARRSLGRPRMQASLIPNWRRSFYLGDLGKMT